MATNDYAAESSGRWDASGSHAEAVTEQRERAFNWARSLSPKILHWALFCMADDINAFTLYERKALLQEAAMRLGPV